MPILQVKLGSFFRLRIMMVILISPIITQFIINKTQGLTMMAHSTMNGHVLMLHHFKVMGVKVAGQTASRRRCVMVNCSLGVKYAKCRAPMEMIISKIPSWMMSFMPKRAMIALTSGRMVTTLSMPVQEMMSYGLKAGTTGRDRQISMSLMVVMVSTLFISTPGVVIHLMANLL